MPNIEVPLGVDAQETAQNLRAAINAAQDTAYVTASGDGTTLTLAALTAGAAGAAIEVSASGAQPVAADATLQPTSRIKTLIGGLVSDLRGAATAFFSGQIGANNPYPKAWAFRVRRWDDGWQDDDPWYPERALISLSDGAIKAMNPAHIIWQCLTDRAWGLGIPESRLNAPAFYRAAHTLHTEGFGLCLSWNRQSELSDFIPVVIAHIGAAFYTDRSNGLLTLRLARGDYDPDTLPVFDYDSGLLGIEDDDSTGGDTSHNEVIVNWRDPIKNEKRSVRVQNLAAIQAIGAVVSVTLDYPGIPTADLAARVAQRDLNAQAGGIRRFKLTLDRRGRKIAPGGVFRISVPARSISNMIIRALAIDDGKTADTTIVVTGVQDIFGLPATAYVVDEPSTWEPPDIGAVAAGTRRWREADYRSMVQRMDPANLALVGPDIGFVTVVARQPTPQSLDYVLATAGSGEDYVERRAAAWAPTGLLSFALGAYTTTVVLQDTAIGLDQIGALPVVAWIEAECVGVTACDPVTRTLTITRGVLDSVPTAHASGVRMWFPERAAGSDFREYATGETVRLKVLTRSSGERLALGSAAEDEVTIAGRQGRPYPPGNLQVNGDPFALGLEAFGELVFTWAHRDRVLQADVLVPHGDGDVGPEAGTTYTIRLYDGDTLVRTVTGISGTTWTYTNAMMVADGVISPKRWELESVRAGLTSTQRYIWTMPHTEVGYGRNYGVDYGVGS